MKLLRTITFRMAIAASIVLSLWAAIFYVVIIEEVNDEIDDQLENYAENIMRSYLAGENKAFGEFATNNRYYLHDITPQEAARREHIVYADEDVYIEEKSEYEPARTLTYIFRESSGQWKELVVSSPTIEKADLIEAILTWLIVLFFFLIVVVITVIAVAVHRFQRRYERIYEEQKIFIGNASHEIQTPLAICMNRLEMLLDDDSLSEVQMRELIKTQQTLQRLSRINHSLLLLTKIDNKQLVDSEAVDVQQTVRQLLPDIAAAYSSKGISLQTDTPKTHAATWQMNKSLAEMLFLNLLKNAYAHTPAGGRVVVAFTEAGLCISNTGEQALDKENIFRRFYHDSKKTGSTGLGLSIAKAIGDYYGLSIEYTFGAHLHTFKIERKG